MGSISNATYNIIAQLPYYFFPSDRHITKKLHFYFYNTLSPTLHFKKKQRVIEKELTFWMGKKTIDGAGTAFASHLHFELVCLRDKREAEGFEDSNRESLIIITHQTIFTEGTQFLGNY
jgi:hypothetical protein